jgi:hypothetical protein
MLLIMLRINVTNQSTVITEFDRLISSIVDDEGLYAIAKRYDDNCRKKYQKKMVNALSWARGALQGMGIETIVQSSFSADVYIDDPGNVDVDMVIPIRGEVTMESAESALRAVGFTFLEDRNVELSKYTHRVYVYSYGDIIIEAKIREWEEYKKHLFMIHNYLDALPVEVRVAWRYIRGRVKDAPGDVSKPIKFLWYMVGAIKTDIDMKDYPMNIFY